MATNEKKKQKLEAKDESIDRLSLLPDVILADILSHLTLRSAVATSVLSRRWRNLWTHLTHLVFDNALILRGHHYWEDYIATINRLLPQFTSPKIHSLTIRSPHLYEAESVQYCSSCLRSWISAICNRNVERIQVIFSNWLSLFVPIPCCMFQCQSLTSLTLSGRFRFDDDLVVNLPKLKNLEFDHHVLQYELLLKLSKSCPLLEQLSLRIDLWELHDSLDLSTLCLKKLCIVAIRDANPQGKLVINASKLEDITLQGLSLAYLSFVKLSKALIKANLILKPGFMDVMDNHWNAVEFAELISSACSLHLNSTVLNTFNTLNDGLLPIFGNLCDLKINLCDINGSWNDVLRFLRSAPILGTLTLKLQLGKTHNIEWVEPEYMTPCGLTNLQRIQIERLKGSAGDYMLLKYILCNAKALKLLSVHVDVPSRRKDSILWKEYEFCDRLFLLENSSTCDIKYSGQYLTVSSTGVNNKRSCLQSIRLGQRLVV